VAGGVTQNTKNNAAGNGCGPLNAEGGQMPTRGYGEAISFRLRAGGSGARRFPACGARSVSRGNGGYAGLGLSEQ